MLVLGGAAIATAALAGIAPAAYAGGHGESCVSASDATYTHSFNGPGGTATITAVKPLCAGESQDFSLVSYTAPKKSYAVPQFVYDAETDRIDAGHRSVSLDVSVPGCFTQVDTIFGASILNEITGSGTQYGNAKVGSSAGIGSRSSGGAAWYNGGDGICAPRPSVTFAGDCDGVLHIHLSNNASATVDAVFLVDGKRVRVRPGQTADRTADAGKPVTIRDNSFSTTTGAWTKPSGCATPPVVPPTTTPATVPTTAPTTPPATTPSTPYPSSATPSASVTPSESASVTPPESVSVTPSASDDTVSTPLPTTTTGAPSSGLPLTGSNATQLALYAIGFLLVGGGLMMVGRQVRKGQHSA